MITQELYDKIKRYVPRRTHRLIGKTNFNYLDITHSVIADPRFASSNWIHIVDKYIYAQVSELRIKKEPLERIGLRNFEIEEKWVCKNCHNESPKSRFRLSFSICDYCYREAHKDRIRQAATKSRAKRKAKTKVYNRAYREKNKEVISTYNKEYKMKNKDAISAYNKEYRAKNKEAIATHRRNYYKKYGK